MPMPSAVPVEARGTAASSALGSGWRPTFSSGGQPPSSGGQAASSGWPNSSSGGPVPSPGGPARSPDGPAASREGRLPCPCDLAHPAAVALRAAGQGPAEAQLAVWCPAPAGHPAAPWSPRRWRPGTRRSGPETRPWGPHLPGRAASAARWPRAAEASCPRQAPAGAGTQTRRHAARASPVALRLSPSPVHYACAAGHLRIARPAEPAVPARLSAPACRPAHADRLQIHAVEEAGRGCLLPSANPPGARKRTRSRQIGRAHDALRNNR